MDDLQETISGLCAIALNEGKALAKELGLPGGKLEQHGGDTRIFPKGTQKNHGKEIKKEKELRNLSYI